MTTSTSGPVATSGGIETSGAIDTSTGSSANSTASTTGPDPDAIAVAVGYGVQTVRSSDGRNWTDMQVVDPQGGDDENVLRGVGYGSGVFIAVGGAALGFSLRSVDGINWTDENRTPASFLSDVAFVGGVFVAAGGNGLRMRSLDQGVTWQDASMGLSAHFRAIASDGTIAVAVGSTYGGDPIQGVVSTTSDGASWSPPQIGGPGYTSIAAHPGVFVALDGAGTIHVSADGVNWQDADTTLPAGLHRVIATENGFLADGDGGYWASQDGMAWELLPSSSVYAPVADIRGTTLSIASPGLLASDDLVTWEPVYTSVASGINDVAVGAPG